MPEYWTTKDIARRYHVSVDTARAWHREGKGPRGFKNGQKILYPDAEVRRYDAVHVGTDQPAAGEWDDAVRVITTVAEPLPQSVRARVAALLIGGTAA